MLDRSIRVVRMGLPGIAVYVFVLAIAAMAVVVTLQYSFDETARHVARLRLEHPTTTKRPHSILPAPVHAAGMLDISRIVPVVAGVGGAPGQVVAGPPESPAPAAQLAEVGTAVNMRAGPSRRSDRLFTLDAGETVEVAETDRGWVHVIRHDGNAGWVYSSYLVPRQPQ